MKTTEFIVQSVNGGAEVKFPAVPPASYRAELALASDPEFTVLPEDFKSILVGAANVMLSAAKRGKAAELHIPTLINVKSVEDWASDHVVGVEDYEIPSVPSSDAEKAVSKNPTEPKE